MNTAEFYKLPHSPYAPGYSRRCPICNNRWPSCKLALRCWYSHPEGKSLPSLSIESISQIMGVSVSTARASWHYLHQYGAPKRAEFMEGENGVAYDLVVHYIRTQRRRKHGLKRGWTIELAERLGITRGRVSQLHKHALAKGDI